MTPSTAAMTPSTAAMTPSPPSATPPVAVTPPSAVTPAQGRAEGGAGEGPTPGGPSGPAAMRGAPRREPGPPPPAHPALQRRSGNTITVRPRRGGTAEGGSPAPAAPPAPPAAPPGPPKKRYPTAEEIQVIGGYLALPRSCLAKNDPHRKKLKIWFSERELERTFCYPSEGALLAAWGPPEEPSPPPAPPGPPEEEEDEDDPPLARGLPGGLRARALLVDESCRR